MTVCSLSELTQVWSNQRHRVEVGELHVLGQILGILLQQLRQPCWTTARDVVLTLDESPPKPGGTGTQQHTAAPEDVLGEAASLTISKTKSFSIVCLFVSEKSMPACASAFEKMKQKTSDIQHKKVSTPG